MNINYEYLRPILIELAEYEPNRDNVDFDKFISEANKIEGVMALDG